MLSGMFFLNPEKSLSGKKVFRSSRRLLLAYFFWSAVYLFVLPGRPLGMPTMGHVVRFFHGAGGPLWFISAILSCYLFSIPLRAIAESRYAECWALASASLLTILPATLRPLSPHLESALPISNHISIVSFPVFYFLLGDYLNRTSLSRNYRKWMYCLGFLGLIAMFVIRIRVWNHGGDRLHEGASPTELWSVLYAVAIFVFFKTAGARTLASHIPTWVSPLAGATFGIYLIHEFFMFGIRFGFHLAGIKTPFGAFPPIAILTESTLVFFLSAITTLVFKRIPILKSVV